MAEAEYGKGVPTVTTPQMGAIDSSCRKYPVQGSVNRKKPEA